MSLVTAQVWAGVDAVRQGHGSSRCALPNIETGSKSMRYGVPSVLDRVGPYVTVLLATSVTLLIWLGAFHYLDVEKIQT